MAVNSQALTLPDDNEWGDIQVGLKPIDWADEMDRISPESHAKIRLPEPETILDEEKGIRTEISYRFNAKNQKEKVSRIHRIEKKMIAKGIAVREGWSKFGRAAKDSPGVDSATTGEADEIFFSLTTNKDELELGIQEPKLKGVIDTIKQINQESLPIPSGPNRSLASANHYVPPSLKRFERVPGYNLDDPLPAVKISNLSMDTTEQDVKELLIQFGKVVRVHMPKDKRNRDLHKGSAFVTFQYITNAEKAISMLNGYPYDHLILKAGWSKPMRRH